MDRCFGHESAVKQPTGNRPEGLKQLLDAKGPKAVADWVKDQKKLLITDTTCRDAHQSLLATRVRTRDIIKSMEGTSEILADELNVPYVNLFDVEGLVDFQTDCYDATSHLNPDGATKVTAYLGEWLTAHFNLADKRGDARYAHWDAALDEYEKMRKVQWGAMSLID